MQMGEVTRAVLWKKSWMKFLDIFMKLKVTNSIIMICEFKAYIEHTTPEIKCVNS